MYIAMEKQNMDHFMEWNIAGCTCRTAVYLGDHRKNSHGDIYVGEVTHTFGVTPGLVPTNAHTFQKFERRSA